MFESLKLSVVFYIFEVFEADCIHTGKTTPIIVFLCQNLLQFFPFPDG